MFDLRPHGEARGIGGIRVQGDAGRRGAELQLTFVVSGVHDRVRLPAPTTAGMAEGLWQRTCFEAFVGREGSAAYHEINLSPSSAWAMHVFRAYRQGAMLHDPAMAPAIRIERADDEVRLEAVVSLPRLDPSYAHASLRIGLAAVVEDLRGGCSYWALAHEPGAPDFHRSRCWTLCLEAPSGACDGEVS